MNETNMPATLMQQILKNRLATARFQALQAGEEISNKVRVSDLKNVKGFWEKTIATLIEHWIDSIDKFKEIDYDKAMTFLTPVQYHQINLFIKENNI